MQINNKEKETYLRLASVVAEKSYSRDLMNYYRLEPRVLKIFLEKYSKKIQQNLSYSTIDLPKIKNQEAIDSLFKSYGLCRKNTIRKEEKIFLESAKKESLIIYINFVYIPSSADNWREMGRGWVSKFNRSSWMQEKLKLYNKTGDVSFIRERIALMRTQKIFYKSACVRAIDTVLFKNERALPRELGLKVFEFLCDGETLSDYIYLVEYNLEKEASLENSDFRDIYRTCLYEEHIKKNKQKNCVPRLHCTIF